MLEKISIKAARINAGYTQREAAKEFGVTPRTLGNWENGTTIPSWSKVKEMESLYKIESDYFSLSNTSLKKK